ncbi:MAG: alpha/beta-hydrolase family protein [Mobilicoccus sp.]|nr:alpha/beta-hydrolase family protein [Mobilicoccus sp.]
MPATRLASHNDSITWPTGARWTDEGPPTRWPALLVATLVLVIAFSPSLLPRPWYMQAIATGVGAGIGYLLTRLAQRLIRRVALLTGVGVVAPRRTRLLAGWLIGLTVTGVAIWWWWANHLAHRETAKAVSMEPPTVGEDLLATGAGVVATVVVVGVLLALRWVWLRISRLLKRFIPKIVARVLAAALIIGALVWVTNDVLFRSTLESVAQAGIDRDSRTPPGLSAPTSELRSGSPEAAQEWKALGHNGMQFTAAGPDAERIEEVTGRSAMDPIRAYAAISDRSDSGESAEGVEDVVALAVAEMQRTGAFERSYVHVVTTTGQGWADEFNVESVEYLTGGDVATVAVQYSALPSVAALVADRARPVEAGTLLTEAVEAEIADLPEEDRPRLLVSGLSLGSYGGHGAFTSAEDMLERVDGAVWIGTPSITPLWKELTANRMGGSPEIAPVVDDGNHIRFLTRPTELDRDYYGRSLGEWGTPRVAYLQYASDSLMWWNPDLLFSEPDWMREGVGHDVAQSLDWYPLITFAQISVDTVTGDDTPHGHGHTYEDDLVPTWAAVLGGLTDDLPDPDVHGDIADTIREYQPEDAD